MLEFFKSFVMTFLPLFIVIDALGSLLYVVIAGAGLSKKEQRRMANIAVGTAAVVGLAFLFFGQLILKMMNISEGSFVIAGGIILLVLSVSEILGIKTIEVEKEALTAIVPLGTPLLCGPATIITFLLLTS